MRKALQQYQNVNLESDINSASPYRITQMLMEGAIRYLKQAKFAIEKKDFEKKSDFISRAEAIIATLAGSLDEKQSPELAANLASLYDYAMRQLIDASVEMNVEKLDIAIGVISDIKSGWDSIPPEEIARAEAIRGGNVNG